MAVRATRNDTDDVDVTRHLLPYLRATGWIDSHTSQSAIDASGRPVPWYRYSAIDFLDERVSSQHVVFEFGSGNSTHWWAERARSITSVEHDQRWAEKVRAAARPNVTLLEVALDADGRYCRTPLRTDRKYNIVIVDGRDRVNCALHCLDTLTDDGVIVWDDSYRRRYSKGLEFLVGRGFRRLRFVGLGPIAGNDGETSVLYRPDNCFGI